MNVAILISQLHGGGLEKYAWRTAQAFADRGHQVSILIASKSLPDLHHPNIQIIQVGKTPRRGFRKLLRYDQLCQSWLKDHPHDIVLGMERTTHQTHYRAGNGVHKIYLKSRTQTDGWLKNLSFKINPLHRTILKFEKRCFEDSTLKVLFTNSQMVKEEILDAYKTPEEKVCVVHNGVEWEEMQSDFDQWQSKKTQLLKERGLRPNCYHFLFVGHGYKRKGLEVTLKGLADLKGHDWELSVVGKDKHRSTFQRLADDLGMGSRIHFFGERSDVRSFYQCCDSLLLPTYYDPFANVTVEALAMGLYVVTSQMNGGKEVLTESSGCVIDDLNDIECATSCFEKALHHPKTEASSNQIRNSVHHLTFDNQLNLMIDKILETTYAS